MVLSSTTTIQMLVKITALDPSCASYTPDEISAIRARNFKHMLDLFAQGNISTFASRFGLNRTVVSLLVNQRSLFTDSYVRKFTQRMDFAMNTFDSPSSYDFFVRVLRQINSFEGVFLSCVPDEIRQRMANGEELEEIGINTVYATPSNLSTETSPAPIEQSVVTAAEITPPQSRRGRPSRTNAQVPPQEVSFIAPSQPQVTSNNVPQATPTLAEFEQHGATFNLDAQARQELQNSILVPRETSSKSHGEPFSTPRAGNNFSTTVTSPSIGGLQALNSVQEQPHAAAIAQEQGEYQVNVDGQLYAPTQAIQGGVFIQPLAKEYTGRLFYHGSDYTERSIAELEQLGLQFAARVEARRLAQQPQEQENSWNWNTNLDYISSSPIYLSDHDYWNFFGRVTHYNQHLHSQLASIRVLSEANLPELAPFQNCIVRLTSRFSKAGYYLFRYKDQLYLRHLSILADKLYCHASNNAFESFLVAHQDIRLIGRVVIALDYKTLG